MCIIKAVIKRSIEGKKKNEKLKKRIKKESEL